MAISSWFARGALAVALAVLIGGCGSSSKSSDSSSTTSTTTTSTTTTSTRTLTDNTTTGASVTTPYGATTHLLTRDTSSCKSARTALGLSGNWLLFSCNVVLGLADASKASVTSTSSATYVSVSFPDMPDYKSTYFPTSGTYSFTANSFTVTGNFSDLYSKYSTTFPDPGVLAQGSAVMYIPISPTQAAAKSQTMALGAVGVAINGVVIYDNLADKTDNIFAEAGSFDENQGHPAGTNYHYHSEPYAISYNDNALIGVMLDGYWIYGRKDYDGTDVSVQTDPSSSKYDTTGDLYVYGGHTGADPLAGTGSTFHYHLTEWKGCFDRGGSNYTTIYSDDGYSSCSKNGSGSASQVDAFFMTGHGNGGVFDVIPTATDNGGTMLVGTTTGIRYYYGKPGSCTGC